MDKNKNKNKNKDGAYKYKHGQFEIFLLRRDLKINGKNLFNRIIIRRKRDTNE